MLPKFLISHELSSMVIVMMLFQVPYCSLSLQEAGRHHKNGDGSNFSALDEDDFQTIIIENKLGCDMYLKKVEQNSDLVELLHHSDSASVWIPPPRFSDRLNVANEFREARHYVAIQILEAKVIKYD